MFITEAFRLGCNNVFTMSISKISHELLNKIELPQICDLRKYKHVN